MVVEHCFTIAYGILVGFGVRAGSEKKKRKKIALALASQIDHVYLLVDLR